MTREGAVMHSGTRHSSVVSGNVPCIALDSGTGDRYNKSRGGDGRRATHMHTLEYTSDLRKMSDLLCIRQLLSVVRALSQQFRLESLRVFSCFSSRVVMLEASVVMPSELSHRLTPELR